MADEKFSKSEGHESIAEQIHTGEYRLIDPLDYLILDYLNAQGETFAGLYPLGHSAKQIGKDLLKDALPMSVLGSRLATLHKMKLIAALVTPGSGGRNAYQRTPSGDGVLRKWKDKQKESETDGE